MLTMQEVAVEMESAMASISNNIESEQLHSLLYRLGRLMGYAQLLTQMVEHKLNELPEPKRD